MVTGNAATIPIGLTWKLRRVAAGLRQQDVARGLGVSITRYSLIERNECSPTKEEILSVERLLPPLPSPAGSEAVFA